MTARGWLAGGRALHSPAHAPIGGDHRRNSSSATAPPWLEAARPALKRSNLAQAVIDVSAVLWGLLVVASASIAVGASFVILLCGNCR